MLILVTTSAIADYLLWPMLSASLRLVLPVMYATIFMMLIGMLVMLVWLKPEASK